MRIGLVGTESSHADHLVQLLNVERRHAARVTAIAGADGTRNRELATRGGIEHVVDDVTRLLGLVDGLVVTDRHGGRHLAHARPFLVEGRPVLVDKPLACTVADAEEMVALARTHGAALTSYSALRWLPGFTDVAAALPELGELQVVVATGPADPASPHGGVFFYGSHPVNVALGLLPPAPCGEVDVVRTRETVVASALVAGTRVEVVLVRPDPAGAVPFHLLAVGARGLAARQFVLDDEYLWLAVEAFLTMAETGEPPIPYDVLVRDVTFLAVVSAAIRPGG